MSLFSKKNQKPAPVKGEEQPENLQKAEQSKIPLDDDLLESVAGGERTTRNPSLPGVDSPPAFRKSG